ncbi:hypothetical protein V8C40DRAFT_230199 [Trichoderma camerunense]
MKTPPKSYCHHHLFFSAWFFFFSLPHGRFLCSNSLSPNPLSFVPIPLAGPNFPLLLDVSLVAGTCLSRALEVRKFSIRFDSMLGGFFDLFADSFDLLFTKSHILKERLLFHRPRERHHAL